ncbi:glutathione S-transferase family protein [Vibrio sp. RC27]
MITVHHLNRSRSKRVIWLLKELNLPYEIVHHQRDATTQLAPQSLKKVHALGKAPVIADGDIILCESGAITEYLLDQASDANSLRPSQGTPAYYQYLQWLHFAEGSLAMPVIANMMLAGEQREEPKLIDRYMNKEIQLDMDYIEATLSHQAYFAGDEFTAADIMMAITLEFAAMQNLLAGYNATLAYLAKIQQRKAYQAASELG